MRVHTAHPGLRKNRVHMCPIINASSCVIPLLEVHVAFLKKKGCNSVTVKFLEPVALVEIISTRPWLT